MLLCGRSSVEHAEARPIALALVATVVLEGLTPAQCLRMALIQTQCVPLAVPVANFSEPSASG
jgi:hypothetical protein